MLIERPAPPQFACWGGQSRERLASGRAGARESASPRRYRAGVQTGGPATDEDPGRDRGARAEPLSVACVIPTHRRPDRLQVAVSSALSQDTGAEVVVVVVDDADDPATRAAVASYRTGRLTCVSNPGQGASSSRNLGVASTTSDVVAFLDDDDAWDGRYLSTALASLERTGADVVFTQIADRPELPVRLHAGVCIAYNPGVTGSNIVMRRRAFERTGGFDEALWVSNDKDFLVRTLDLGLRYVVVPEPLVHYKHHALERLTEPSARRLRGLQLYYSRYRARMRPTQRLHLLGVIHSTAARLSPPGRRRSGHRALALLMFLASPRPSAVRLASRRQRRSA